MEPLEYLAWAHPRYGRVRCDLASSGARPVAADALGPVAIDAPSAPVAYRDALSAWLGVPQDEVLPTLGTSQALWLACAAVLAPGDVALVEAPSYEPLRRVPAGRGARVIPVWRREEAGWALDAARVDEALATTGARALLVSAPHDPTGRDDADAELAALAAACAAHGAALVVDEVYRPFSAGRPRSARGLGPTVWTVGSLTKRYGLGSARCGWVTGPAGGLGRAVAALQHGVGQNGTVHAALGLAALGRLDALAAAALPDALVDAGRARVDAVVQAAPGARWRPPGAAPFGLVTVPGAGDLRRGVEALADEAGVLVAPGAFFGVPEAFRVSWTAAPDAFEAGLAALAPLLDAAR